MADRTEIRFAPEGPRGPWAEKTVRRWFEWPRSRDHVRAAPARRTRADFPEIDCVRHRAPPGVIAWAERRAREVGVTADQALLASGLQDEETYARALARSLGLPFEPLDQAPRVACPLPNERLIDAKVAGILPLVDVGGTTFAVAPRGLATRRLFSLVKASTELRHSLRITTSERLARFVLRHAGAALGARAAFGLARDHPDLSAAPGKHARPWRAFAAAATFFLVIAIAAPDLLLAGVGVAFSAIFLSWIALRAFGALTFACAQPSPPRRRDESLPVYTVIVALYREAAAIKQLVASLDALDWPREKLDVKLVLEPDDVDTRAALAAMRLGRPYEVMIAPAIGPRTKPKALNAALPFARGAFVAVFDAEDRPEPDQLRRAFEAFAVGDGRLACVQARLTIDNTRDNWLTGMFTAEYAGLFDVFLPGLAAHGLPLPLGGSSNHFRTPVLRAVGGWDPFNLTEDADLGMRLARFGYSSAVISSTTYEEAPARLRAWLKQRRRWFQGWMQTWLVHMRAPARLLRELGLPGFLTLQLVVGGTVLSALVHPIFVAFAAIQFAVAPPHHEGIMWIALAALYGGTFVGGYVSSVVLGLVGLARRRLLGAAWVLLLVPLHWLLLSLAAWQAAVKLARDPYRWDKTEHGLARTSRMPACGACVEPARGRIRGDD